MTFADSVTILRAGTDAYGNARRDWTDPATHAAKAFVSGHLTKAYFPVGTDVVPGDRLQWTRNGVLMEFDVVDPVTVRSPSRDVLMTCGLRRVEA